MLGHSLSIMFSNLLVAFATAFALPAGTSLCPIILAHSIFDAANDTAKNAVEGHHLIGTDRAG